MAYGPQPMAVRAVDGSVCVEVEGERGAGRESRCGEAGEGRAERGGAECGGLRGPCLWQLAISLEPFTFCLRP